MGVFSLFSFDLSAEGLTLAATIRLGAASLSFTVACDLFLLWWGQTPLKVWSGTT